MLTLIIGMLPVPVSDSLDIGTFFTITDVGTAIANVLSLTLIFGTLAFVLYFVLSAFEWLTAGGDKGKVESARNRMMNAFTGITLIAATWAISLIVTYVLGLPVATP